MVVFPNAKINLGLHILRKRPDGYHDIESCFYPIGWSDILEILLAKQLSFNSVGIDIPGDSSQNLCVKAYELLRKDFDISPVSIHLQKNIPIGAGLGGGSADGSFALRALNDLFELSLSNTELEKYALELGSDCPFFISNTPVMVGGRGENLIPIEQLSLKGYFMVVIYPGVHVSTGVAYAKITPDDSRGSLREVLFGNVDTWQGSVVNDFEQGVKSQFGSVEEAISLLESYNPVYVSMTGSGSSVFALFKEEVKVELPASYKSWRGFL